MKAVGLSAVLLLNQNFIGIAQAVPRNPLPPWPEKSLGVFGWDEEYFYVPLRQRAIGADNAQMRESWNGYALVRQPTDQTPVAIPALDFGGKPLLAPDSGAVRFWFDPNWSSVSKLNTKEIGSPEMGPGQAARLLELVNLDGQFPDIRWTLYANPEGNQLRLAGMEYGRVKNMILAPLDVAAGQWRMVTICYSPEGSQLWIDGQLAATGAGIKPGAASSENRLGLVVGSSVTGSESANGQFEEIVSFDYWPDAEQQQFYYRAYSKRALLGPVGSPEEEQFKMDLVHAMDGPPSPGEGGGSGSSGGTNPPAYNYDPGTFYVELLSATNNQASVMLHNTVADTMYELQSVVELTNGPWASEQFVIGAVGATSTVTTVPWQDRTNTLFLQARSWADTDGDGLPDWWETAHGLDPDLPDTGNTGISDGYKDGDGDGWSNLEELQNGTDPDTFNTPPPPNGLTAAYGATSTNVTVAWNTSLGNVLSYSVIRKWQGQWQTSTVSAVTLTLADSFTLPSYWRPSDEPTYRIQANYSSGASALSEEMTPGSQVGGLAAAVVRGAGGTQRLVVSALPSSVASVRLWLWRNSPSFSITNYTVAAGSFVDGIYDLPSAWTPTLAPDDDLYDWYVQPVDGDGNLGVAAFAGSNHPIPFFDGREQLRQNLAFQLRAANTSEPLVFDRDWSLNAGREVYDYAWNPSSYAYAGIVSFEPDRSAPWAYRNEWQPFDDNYTYRNLAFATGSLDGNGYPTTGAGYGPGTFADLDILSPPAFEFVPPTSQVSISTVLSSNLTQWLYYEPYDSSGPIYRIGISHSGGTWVMASNAKNLFGLPFLSAKRANSGGVVTLSAGGSIADTEGVFYPETAQPQLQTVGYYFGNVDTSLGGDSVPGHVEFANTNTQPLLISGVGNAYYLVAGYARQAILNGYTNKFAYLGQYFDKAYKQGTTNETGVLSPYGEFLPTEPGPVELVTMADLSTGQRGTGVVNVIKLQLDVNHDGVMDLSWSGPDNANTQDRPFRFWVNNDHDAPSKTVDLDYFPERDVNMALETSALADYTDGEIHTQRNLEDFARLWIRGLPALPSVEGYSATIEIVAATGSPSLNLYRAYDSTGGTGYLTDTNVAAQQFSQELLNGQVVFDYSHRIAAIEPGQPYTLSVSPTEGYLLHSNFLFEASGEGTGWLDLNIWKDGEIIASHSQTIEFRDVKKLYERTLITDVTQAWPDMVEDNRVSSFRVVSTPNFFSDETDETAVFVHGWRMTDWDYDSFSATMFKRLYWQGFQGRFASVRWPTRSEDTEWLPGGEFLTYNRSEHIAFKSGKGTADYLSDLRSRFPNQKISVAAHSMGNIVMMETLKQLVAVNQSPIDNYVMMQAAVPAQAFDTGVTNLPALISAEQEQVTPNTYANYASGVTNALSVNGKIVNFFNPEDFALVNGVLLGIGSWEFNQAFNFESTNGVVSMKPNTYLGYYTTGTSHLVRTNEWNTSGWAIAYGGLYTGHSTRSVNDSKEIMPFVARPRSKAVGAQGGVGGQILGGELNLNSQLGFGDGKDDHSGQFNRNIQDSPVWPFYSSLKASLFPAQQ